MVFLIGAVLGITLVISTAGAGAPLVLTTIAGACDVGLACEGVQETYYGAIKDIETPSINPVRDYICMGNQEAYDMLSMVSYNMCFASASINTIVSVGSGENIKSQALKEVVQIRTFTIWNPGGWKFPFRCSYKGSSAHQWNGSTKTCFKVLF